MATVSADNDYTDEGDFVYTNATVVESESTSLEKLEAVDQVEIFPNPIDTDFGIRLDLNKNEDIEIKLTDMKGQEVQSIFRGELSSGVQTVRARVNRKVSPGLYMVNISADGKERTETVIVK